MMRLFFFLGLILITQNLFSVPDIHVREFLGLSAARGNAIVKVSDGEYHFQFLSSNSVKCSFHPNDATLKDLSFALANPDYSGAYKTKENENELNLYTDNLTVKITKKPFKLEYFRNKELLISEKSAFHIADTAVWSEFAIDNSELLYGGGARVLGMNRRGHRLQLYNRAHYGYETQSALMNYSMPVFVSSKKYAVLFDNPSSGWLDLDSKRENTVCFQAESGMLDYCVVSGNDWFNLVDNFTRITGRQPMPPRWALGNFSSRFGYHSQAETENTVQQFFNDSILLDAVIIDIYWFGQGIFNHMGNLDWYTDSFPNPEKMIANFNAKGVKTILVTEPFILTTSNRWQEAVDKQVLCTDSIGKPFTYNFYFGNTGLVDIFNPEAREWFWDIYKRFTTQGIGGWWGDLGEPEVHPAALQHKAGGANELHNAYGHEWAKMVYDGYQKDFPEQRPFILMRSGYAGSQRFGMIPWTGDVSRSWGGLKPQVEISLSMGLQGIAYMHSDLGGFAGGDSLDNELYTRWLQYGVFQPVYRPHAQEQIPAEPVFQSKETKDRARQSINLRYKLLPYLYNMAYQNHVNGKPLMIPLFFIDNNPALATYDSAYMWGNSLLVSPVKTAGAVSQRVYLPSGGFWFNFNTELTTQGGKYTDVALNMDNIPVFAKAGSFIAMQQKPVSVSEYNIKNLEIHYYSHASVTSASDSLFNDNGVNPGTVEKGEWEKLYFKYNIGSMSEEFHQTYRLGDNYEEFTGGNNQLIVHGAQKPKKVTVNGQSATNYTYDATKKILVIEYSWGREEVLIKWE